MLKVMIAPVTRFQQNCSIVWCDETMEGTAVDPGGDFDMLKEAIAQQGIKVTKVLLTHGHVDHASAAGTMADHYRVKIEGPHRDDLFLIEGLPGSGRKYNFPAYKPFVPDRWLEGGEQVTLGNLTFDVVHCPGHTPGHVVFVHKPSKVAFVGDVLFRNMVVPVHSVLKPRDNLSPAPLKPPRSEPYPWMPFVWIGVAALLAIGAWTAVVLLARRAAAASAPKPAIPPDERFRKAVAAARSWAQLADAVREYIGATTKTTTEVLAQTSSSLLDEVLHQGDLEKFSPWGPRPGDLRALKMRALELIVESSEEVAA